MAIYVWRVLSGSATDATSWYNADTGANPALTPPGIDDTAVFLGDVGTVSGNLTVEELDFGKADSSWLLTGRLTTATLFLTSRADLTIARGAALIGKSSGSGPSDVFSFDGALTVDGGTISAPFNRVSVGYGQTSSVLLEGGATGNVLRTTVGSGSEATLTLTGTGTRWTSSDMQVDTGHIVVTDHAKLSFSLDDNFSTSVLVGRGAGSGGDVTLTGGATWEYTGVDQRLLPVLEIGGFAGDRMNANGVGTVSVSGTAGNVSTLDLGANAFRVGCLGTGTLAVGPYGHVGAGVTDFVNAIALLAGERAGSNGTVILDGADARLTLTGFALFGRLGTAQLMVRNGGVLTSTATGDSGIIVGGAERLGAGGGTGDAVVELGGKIVSNTFLSLGRAASKDHSPSRAAARWMSAR